MSFFLPARITCNGEKFVKYLDIQTIERRIDELGQNISRDYEDKKPIFIGVLNGAFIFLSDLMRRVSIPCEVDFIKLSSYGDEKVSMGKVTEIKQIDADLRNRHVILVEDIVDTGLSINYLKDKIQSHHPASVGVATLLHKSEATKYPVRLDYVGFLIPDRFVLGYGMDYAQEGRNLGQIYISEKRDGK